MIPKMIDKRGKMATGFVLYKGNDHPMGEESTDGCILTLSGGIPVLFEGKGLVSVKS